MREQQGHITIADLCMGEGKNATFTGPGQTTGTTRF